MLTGKQFEVLRKEIERLLAPIGERGGLDIKAGNIKYDPNHFDLTISFSKKEVNGKSFEQAEFERVAFLYGFEKTDYKRKFAMGGKEFELCGFQMKAKTMPILANCVADGKKYKFGREVKRLLV
jgi:hypothetical protein